MEIDPNTLAFLSAIGGSVAKTVVDKVWINAEKWLSKYFKDHQPKAQEKAQDNALDFLIDLGNRITELEKDLNDETKAKEQFLSVLSDPDFSAVLHNSVIAAARTNSKEKHKLLARIVSQKLVEDPESLKSLAGNKAIEIIPYLSPTHLKILAIMTLIRQVRPTGILENISNLDDCTKWYNDWLLYYFSYILLIDIKKMDIIYLRDNSCLENYHGKNRVLETLLIQILQFSLICDINEFLESDTGKELIILWDKLNQSTLTSLGLLIGVYVLDEFSGYETSFPDWY